MFQEILERETKQEKLLVLKKKYNEYPLRLNRLERVIREPKFQRKSKECNSGTKTRHEKQAHKKNIIAKIIPKK